MSRYSSDDQSKRAWRHHYLPQFYLRRWVSPPENKLWCYRRRGDSVTVDRRAPRAVGFERDLLTLVSEGEVGLKEDSDIVEKQYGARIDDPASAVLSRLCSTEAAPTSEEDKRVWARFMRSLSLRNPRVLRGIDSMANDIPSEILGEIESRGDHGREVAARIRMISYTDAMVRNAVRVMSLRAVEDDEDYYEMLCGLRWCVINIAELEGVRFITSDRPVLFDMGAARESFSCMTMPLSPDKLLFIHPKDWELTKEFLALLIISQNRVLLQEWEISIYSHVKLEDEALRRSLSSRR